jgi:Flp pilus assembly protein TadG
MKTKKNPNKERGQSLVELALSLMVILFLLTGAVEFSIALFQYVGIRDAAQEGALYGSIHPLDTTGVRNRAIDAANDVVQLSPSNITINITGSSCEGTTGGAQNTMQVEIRFSHKIFMPLVAPMIGRNSIELYAQTTNVILQPTC